MAKDTLSKVQKIQKELNEVVLERTSEVEAMLACMLSGVHMLLLGPPGTAKSLITNALCDAIDGSSYFQLLLTKFSTPEEVFGPVSMKGLENDEFRRNTDGYFPDAWVSFLDEVFKANSGILNSLLTALNERKYHNGGKLMKIPLLFCMGASNELPQGEELGALYDRFPVRFWVDRIKSQENMRSLLRGNLRKPSSITKISIEEICQAQHEIQTVGSSDEIIDLILEIRSELQESRGITVSDRRWKSIMPFMQALAWLRGNKEVTKDEIEFLGNVLWDEPNQKKIIDSVVLPKSNPLNLLAITFSDEAEELFNSFKSAKEEDKDSMALNCSGQLKNMLKEIEASMVGRPDSMTKKLSKVKDVVHGYRKEILSSI